jgi:hypothetical protein
LLVRWLIVEHPTIRLIPALAAATLIERVFMTAPSSKGFVVHEVVPFYFRIKKDPGTMMELHARMS